MKIVMDIREAQLERVGVAVYCSNLIMEFVRSAEDVQFIFIGSSDMPTLNIDFNGHEVKYIAPNHSSNLFLKLNWYLKLPFLLNRLNADLYFGPFFKFPFLKFPCKTVFTLHDAGSISSGHLVGSKLASLKNKFFTSNLIRNVNGIVCISKYCQDEFETLFPGSVAKRSTVIYHGVPKEITENIDNNSGALLLKISDIYNIKKPYLITVGTVYPKKNVVRLIEAMALIKELDIDLVVCGMPGNNSDDIYRAPKRLNVEDRVHFLGRVDTEYLIPLISGAEIFVFPSLYEGFGIPILEAFLLKVPVISSKVTCLPEVAGDAAVYFDPLSVTELVSCIKKLIEDDSLRARQIEKGFARVKDFTWEKSANQHLEFFSKIVFGKDK